MGLGTKPFCRRLPIRMETGMHGKHAPSSHYGFHNATHKLFTQVLREEECDLIHQGKLMESQCLSTRMSESVSNGHFWFCLAATSSYGFDDIYWRFIDPVYYGPFTSIEDRIQLLSQQERDDLEPFVQLKIQQAGEGTVDQHWTVEEMFDA